MITAACPTPVLPSLKVSVGSAWWHTDVSSFGSGHIKQEFDSLPDYCSHDWWTSNGCGLLLVVLGYAIPVRYSLLDNIYQSLAPTSVSSFLQLFSVAFLRCMSLCLTRGALFNLRILRKLVCRQETYVDVWFSVSSRSLQLFWIGIYGERDTN
jgi:hypothetical protein